MGSQGYAECHWCKKVGWDYYIPDGVGGPLCTKCLCEDEDGSEGMGWNGRVTPWAGMAEASEWARPCEEDPSEALEVFPFERLKQSITAQMCYRCVWDNQQYTIREFSDYYGKAAGESLWKLAPHFNSIKEFCKCFALKIVSSPELRGLTQSSALFGLWVPGCLLLADVHHLASGKLKGSRLAPLVWHSDIWDTAWQIGHAGTQSGMMVLDWTQLNMDSEDPLANLGRVEMEKELKEFCDLLDGRRTPPELWIISELERMTGWPCAVSGLHMPCQAMFFACHAILIFNLGCVFHVVPCHVMSC